MKKIISIGCLLMAFVCLIGLFPQNAKADSDFSYNKKIVSVVYDDSGSMDDYNSYRYVYANYAMQTFCGLLGAEDDLYITYMNRFQTEPQKIDITNTSIQNSIDEIRKYAITTGGTPYESVKEAMALLEHQTDTNEKTEYYLVVITDGKFSGVPSDPNDGYIFSNFSEKRMANGTKPNIIYLGIGSDVTKLNLNKSNVKEFYATDEGNSSGSRDGIVAKMSEIANIISHRSQVNTTDIMVVNDRTFEISSDIPLSNIAALVQGSGAKIVSVVHKESGEQLKVGRNVSSYWSTEPKWAFLSSQSFLIQAAKENIPEGTYVLTFDRAVSKENVVLMLEPALELRLFVTCNGREIDQLTELDKLHEKDKISVRYKIYEYGTDNRVLLSDLPQGTTASISVFENGIKKQTAQDEIDNYSLSQVKTEFKATLQIPGFNAIETYIDFTPLKFVNYTVGAEYGGAADSVKLKDIGNPHDLSLIFTLYADGIPIKNPENVREFAPQIKLSPEGNAGTMEILSDGRIKFIPNAAPITGFVNGAMAVTATCEINGVSASKTYIVLSPVYKVEAEYGSGTNSVKLTDIAKSHDLFILFKVYETGILITDKALIEAFGYQITVSPNGNAGTTEVLSDGRIKFTPHTAPDTGFMNGAMTVTVTCVVNGISASETYSVIEPVYTVKAEFGSSTESIKLTDIANAHDLSIVFTVYRDSILVTDKSSIEKIGYQITVSPDGNDGITSVTDDGKIIFVPNKAKKTVENLFTVAVTCKAGGGSGSKTYTVLNPAYTVKAEFGSNIREIHLDNIGTNHGLSIVFKVYEVIGDQVMLITNKSEVEALIPDIYVSEDGNGGKWEVEEDGKIIYAPDTAAVKPDVEFYDVRVTCTVAGASATESYRIILPDIYIEVVLPENEIAKNGFFGNTESISFYIVKDGRRLTKDEVINSDAVILNEKHGKLSLVKTIADDGMIIFTPVSENEQEIFWLFNGFYYCFGLSGEDLNIHFVSDYGTKEVVMPVGQASRDYLIWMVGAPIFVCFLLIGAIIWECICFFGKPRFPKKSTLCVGKITLVEDGDDRDVIYYHKINRFTAHSLNKYNTFKYLFTPNLKPGEIKDFSPLRFQAANDGLKYTAMFFTDALVSFDQTSDGDGNLDANKIRQWFQKNNNKPLKIKEIQYPGVASIVDQTLDIPNASMCYIFDVKTTDKNGDKHIQKATIIFYI